MENINQTLGDEGEHTHSDFNCPYVDYVRGFEGERVGIKAQLEDIKQLAEQIVELSKPVDIFEQVYGVMRKAKIEARCIKCGDVIKGDEDSICGKCAGEDPENEIPF